MIKNIYDFEFFLLNWYLRTEDRLVAKIVRSSQEVIIWAPKRKIEVLEKAIMPELSLGVRLTVLPLRWWHYLYLFNLVRIKEVP